MLHLSEAPVVIVSFELARWCQIPLLLPWLLFSDTYKNMIKTFSSENYSVHFLELLTFFPSSSFLGFPRDLFDAARILFGF